ncbi:hypothetical protein FAIPA1_170020 [Frankia sp. AiPs1]
MNAPLTTYLDLAPAIAITQGGFGAEVPSVASGQAGKRAGGWVGGRAGEGADERAGG